MLRPRPNVRRTRLMRRCPPSPAPHYFEPPDRRRAVAVHGAAARLRRRSMPGYAPPVAASAAPTTMKTPIRAPPAPTGGMIKLVVLLLVRGWYRRCGLLAAPCDHVDGGELPLAAGVEAERCLAARRPAEDRRPHRAIRRSGAERSQRAGRGGGAEGRALRRGSERSAGQALRRLRALAHRDRVAGTGACA